MDAFGHENCRHVQDDLFKFRPSIIMRNKGDLNYFQYRIAVSGLA